MMRFTVVACLAVLISTALYLPARFPAERFVAHLRAEQASTRDTWGEQKASEILERAITLIDVTSGTHYPDSTNLGAGEPNADASQALRQVIDRLRRSPYLRSANALIALALYRAIASLQWLPWLGPFVLSAFADGATVRRIRSQEFRQHDPERFSACIVLSIVICAAFAGSLIAPLTLHVATAPTVVVVLTILLSRALANFHRSH